MKAYVINKYGSLDELHSALSTDVAEPVPGADEILVDVHVAALNFFDILQTAGKYQHQPKMPWVAGAEFAGVVSPNSPIPKGCTFIPGKTRVFGSGQGAFAEKIATVWTRCNEIPSAEMTYEEASGISLTFPTSYTALVDRAELKAGETVLVHAGAGGVGSVAVQIAKALGATVIATAGSADKLAVCKKAGADYVLNYKEEGWQKEVLAITKGKGVNVVYDPVGMTVPSLKCIAWKGRVIVVGFAGGAIEKVPANLILLKNIAIVGLHWGAYIQHEPQAIAGQWAGILELFRQRKIKALTYEKVYSLETLPEGLKALQSRGTWGKVVVRVRKEERL